MLFCYGLVTKTCSNTGTGFTDDRNRGRARAWLAAEGYAPAPL